MGVKRVIVDRQGYRGRGNETELSWQSLFVWPFGQSSRADLPRIFAWCFVTAVWARYCFLLSLRRDVKKRYSFRRRLSDDGWVTNSEVGLNVPVYTYPRTPWWQKQWWSGDSELLAGLKVVTPAPPPPPIFFSFFFFSFSSSRRHNRDENQLDCLCWDSNPCPGHSLLRRADCPVLHALPTPYEL